MRNIKYAIDEVVRKPLRLFVIILQVLVGTMILFEGIGITLKTYDTVKRTKNMLTGKEVYRLINDSDIYEDTFLKREEDFNSRVYSLYEKLRNSKDFSICSASDSNILIKDFCDNDKFYYMPGDENKYDIDPYNNVRGVFSDLKGFYISDGFEEVFPLEVSGGRNFVKDDFELEDNIPVILGAEYKSIYNIGDKFKYFDYMNKEERNIQVVGILKEDSYYFDQADIITLDNRIICPMENLRFNENIGERFENLINTALIITDDKESSLKEIREYSSSLGLYTFSMKSCKGAIQFLIEELTNECKDSMFLNFVIFLFIAIGIITVQLNSIKERMKEYGIHLLIGASKKDIAFRNFYSVSIYLGVGMLLGSYFEYFMNKNIYNFYTWDNRGIIILFVIYIILLFIISYIPYRKIRKLEVNNIIRGLGE